MTTTYIIEARIVARHIHDEDVVTERTIQQIKLAVFDSITDAEAEFAGMVRFERLIFDGIDK